MDIERYECRAILGSLGIFSDPRYIIKAISTEWNYADGRLTHLCPSNDMERLVKFLVGNSYEPSEGKNGGEKLDPKDCHKWRMGTHIIWRKNTTG